MVSAELKLIIDELSTQGKMIFHEETTEEKKSQPLKKKIMSFFHPNTKNGCSFLMVVSSFCQQVFNYMELNTSQ
nr:hypothetical protein [Amylolactobacillus amylophilus]